LNVVAGTANACNTRKEKQEAHTVSLVVKVNHFSVTLNDSKAYEKNPVADRLHHSVFVLDAES
jgi:hypothetical protein